MLTRNFSFMKKQLIALACYAAILAFIFYSCKEEQKEASDETIKPTATEIKSVFINGDSLHYIEMGQGDPVIFVHGTLDD